MKLSPYLVFLVTCNSFALSLGSTQCDKPHIVMNHDILSDAELNNYLPLDELQEVLSDSRERKGEGKNLIDKYYQSVPGETAKEEVTRKLLIADSLKELRKRPSYSSIDEIKYLYLIKTYQSVVDELSVEMEVELIFWPRISGACNVNENLSRLAYSRFVDRVKSRKLQND